jgi:hypothetical protein
VEQELNNKRSGGSVTGAFFPDNRLAHERMCKEMRAIAHLRVFIETISTNLHRSEQSRVPTEAWRIASEVVGFSS